MGGMLSHLLNSIVTLYMDHINYGTITLFMGIESSFIPFPSEIIIPPAAWKAAQGRMSLYGVVFCGTLGSVLGALFNYYLAMYLGRKLVYLWADTKISHLLLINRASLEKAESYFIRYGKSSTFIGRLVPAVRQLISIPAGFARMRMRDFLFFTTLGSFIWNAILAALGFYLYSQKELLNKYYQTISYALLGLGLFFVTYLVVKSFRSNRKSSNP
jgi:membrane protein DedA with SNARE-associated domain